MSIHKAMSVWYKGIDFKVDFEYQEAEEEVTHYPDGSGYPGSPPSIEVTKIWLKPYDFTQFIMDLDPDGFEEAIVAALGKVGEYAD